MVFKSQQLNRSSFPPGSSREFIDSILRLTGDTNSAGGTAQDAHQLAQDAKDIADAAATKNAEQDQELSQHETDINALKYFKTYITRQKSEVVYSGISLVIPTTVSNFFTLLNGLTPTSGNPAPFFQLASGRLKALNKNLDLKLKFTLEGTFAGSVQNRSLAFVFGTVVPDTIYINRNVTLPTDSMNLNTFFSVEEGDDITNPGITCTVQAIGGAFTATRIKIIATQ